MLGPISVVDGRSYAVSGDAPIADLPVWIAMILARRYRARHPREQDT